jgi:tRNA G46 methylase TrmB
MKKKAWASKDQKQQEKENDSMPLPHEPPKNEHPSTYFVQDRSNKEELTRLRLQDQMLNAGMGGVLPEQPDPTIFQRVLDVGCGTGGWLMEAARTYPSMSLLFRTLLPFLHKWSHVPDDYEEIYRQALDEMQDQNSLPKAMP